MEKKVEKEEGKIFTIGELKFNSYELTVEIGEDKFELPSKDFDLLHYLASNPDQVFTREELLNIFWEEDDFVFDRLIDVHINRIKQKLDCSRKLIESVIGGYKFIGN